MPSVHVLHRNAQVEMLACLTVHVNTFDFETAVWSSGCEQT